nr:PA1571 family protein [Pseudomonas graminis]
MLSRRGHAGVITIDALTPDEETAMSLQSSSNQEPVFRPQSELQLGGAILDRNGQEILITEEMVQAACQECEKYWVQPEKQD